LQLEKLKKELLNKLDHNGEESLKLIHQLNISTVKLPEKLQEELQD